MKIWAQPLRRQLVVAILWFLAPMLAAAAVPGLDEFRYTVGELTDQTQAMAARAASAIERELTGVDRMARNLSMNPALRIWMPTPLSLTCGPCGFSGRH